MVPPGGVDYMNDPSGGDATTTMTRRYRRRGFNLLPKRSTGQLLNVTTNLAPMSRNPLHCIDDRIDQFMFEILGRGGLV